MRLINWLEKALVVATASTFLLAAVRSLPTPLSVDEGYNLEVVDNLARGVGYASYGNHRLDAMWSAKELLQELLGNQNQTLNTPKPWFFDPRVTTGPAILLPLAGIWWAFPGQILPLRFFLWLFVPLFVATLWWAIPVGPKRLPAVTLAASMCCSLWFTFKAGAVLGEFPAVVFFTLGCVALVRGRSFLAGVLFGFAILTKMIMLFAVLVAFAVCFIEFFLQKQASMRKILLLFAGFVTPIVMFQTFQFISLGSADAFLSSWRQFFAFAREQTTGQGTFSPKWQSVKTMGPGLFFALAAATAALLGLMQCVNPAGTRQTHALTALPRRVGTLMLWGSVPMALLWIFRSAQTSYRQVLPAAFLLFSGLILVAYHSLALEARHHPPRGLSHIAYTVLVLLVFIAVARWAQVFWRSGELSHRYALQLEAGRMLRESGAKGISPLIRFTEPFPVLSGLRVNPCPSPHHAMVVTAWAQIAEKKSRESFRQDCTDIIAETPDVLICWPKAEDLPPWPLADLKLADWGPKQLRAGQVPNPQPGGGGALWFRLGRPVAYKRTLALLVNEKVAGLVTWSTSRDWFSSPFDPTFSQGAQTLQLTLWDPCTGERKEVGQLEVKP